MIKKTSIKSREKKRLYTAPEFQRLRKKFKMTQDIIFNSSGEYIRILEINSGRIAINKKKIKKCFHSLRCMLFSCTVGPLRKFFLKADFEYEKKVIIDVIISFLC